MKELLISLGIYPAGIILTGLYYRYLNPKKRDEENARGRLTARVIFWPVAKLIFSEWPVLERFVNKITGITRRRNRIREMTASISRMKKQFEKEQFEQWRNYHEESE